MTEPYYRDDAVTLYHGDCLEITEWLAADVLVTDPPYGTDNWGGYGRRQLGLMTISGDSDTAIRDAVLSSWGQRPAAVFASPRGPQPPGGWSAHLVWDKQRPGLGSPWRWQHENVFIRGAWRNVPGLPSVLRVTPDGDTRETHPHSKPLSLMSLLLGGAPLGIIADPFAGIGSTLVAAKQLGRRAIGVELEERYCEVIARRLAQDVLDFGGEAS